MAWVFLAVAISSEVTATLCLRAAEGFSKVGPTVVVVIGYVISFVALSQALQRGMSLGVAYGIWSGIGVATVAVLGRAFFGDALSPTTGVGLLLIIAGVAVVQLSSSSHA